VYVWGKALLEVGTKLIYYQTITLRKEL